MKKLEPFITMKDWLLTGSLANSHVMINAVLYGIDVSDWKDEDFDSDDFKTQPSPSTLVNTLTSEVVGLSVAAFDHPSSSRVVQPSTSRVVLPPTTRVVQYSRLSLLQPSKTSVQPTTSRVVQPSTTRVVQFSKLSVLETSKPLVKPSTSRVVQPSTSRVVQPSTLRVVQPPTTRVVQFSNLALVQPSKATVEASESLSEIDVASWKDEDFKIPTLPFRERKDLKGKVKKSSSVPSNKLSAPIAKECSNVSATPLVEPSFSQVDVSSWKNEDFTQN